LILLAHCCLLVCREQKAIDSGVVPAYNNVGNAYASGQGVAKDEAEAAKFFERGAEQGDPTAMFTLGTWLHTGKGGLAVDKARAFELQLKAAAGGHPHAMYNAGCGYLQGSAGAPDVRKAAEWFLKASDKGVTQATANLGQMLWRGLGVKKDLKKAEGILSRHAAHNPDCAAMLEAVREEIAATENPQAPASNK
jgi:TPR repeat protein